MSSRIRAARSYSCASLAARISRSIRRIIGAAWPETKVTKSSTIARWSSASTRPTQGAEHLPM